MAIGMTYQEFWYGPPERCKAYREAHKLRMKYRNHEMWMQGAYFYSALCSAAPMFAFKPHDPQPYLDKPFAIDKEETEKREEAKEEKAYYQQLSAFQDFAKKFNQRGKKDEQCNIRSGKVQNRSRQ